MKKELHYLRMKRESTDDPAITREYFDKTIYDLKKKSNKYNFIANSGESMRDALFKIMFGKKKKNLMNGEMTP